MHRIDPRLVLAGLPCELLILDQQGDIVESYTSTLQTGQSLAALLVPGERETLLQALQLRRRCRDQARCQDRCHGRAHARVLLLHMARRARQRPGITRDSGIRLPGCHRQALRLTVRFLAWARVCSAPASVACRWHPERHPLRSNPDTGVSHMWPAR